MKSFISLKGEIALPLLPQNEPKFYGLKNPRELSTLSLMLPRSLGPKSLYFP